MQSDSSIEAQQRKCRDSASKNGHKLLPALEFNDAAISGSLLSREGFDRMLQAAKTGEFSVLYLFSLSRFARSCNITMTLLLRLVYKYHVRVICVAEKIDSAEEGWKLKAQLHAIMDEQFLAKVRESVISGQENNQLKDLSNGDYCFGFRSEPIPGSEAGRRGKDPKPYRRVVIDPEEAGWVRKIFEWFVVDRKSISWIAKKLTTCCVKKDHRASTLEWIQQIVRMLLRNVKYIGIWPWGRKTNVRDPDTGLPHQEDRAETPIYEWC